MNLSLKNLTLVLSLFSLVILVACTKEIGAIPDVEIDPGDAIETPDDVVEAPVDEVVAPPVNVTEGNVTNDAIENLDPATDPANAIEDGNSADAALTDNQKNYWDNVDEDQIDDLIEGGDSEIQAQISALIAAFQNDPRLSKYIPTIFDPSGSTGRLDDGARIESSVGDIEVPGMITQSTQQENENDCFRSITNTRDSIIARLDAQLEAQLQAVEAKYLSELASLENNIQNLQTNALNGHITRKSTFFSEFVRIASSVNTGVNTGDLSATDKFILDIINKGVLGLNTNASFTLQGNELELIDNLFQESLATLNANRDAAEAPAREDHAAKVEKARADAEAAYLVCHNQGGNTGG